MISHGYGLPAVFAIISAACSPVVPLPSDLTAAYDKRIVSRDDLISMDSYSLGH